MWEPLIPTWCRYCGARLVKNEEHNTFECPNNDSKECNIVYMDE